MSDETPEVSMRLFQINERDLAELEHTLPMLLDSMYEQLDGRTRTQWRRVIQIIGNVRWNYGPPMEVERIDA